MELSFDQGRTTRSCGRNGYYTSTGLSVTIDSWATDPAAHTLTLAGITSRNGVATGHQCVPVADVPALIRHLQQQLHEYYQQQDDPSGYVPEVLLPQQPDARVSVQLPGGREVLIHRTDDNQGTCIGVWASPAVGGLDDSIMVQDYEATPPAG